MTTLQCALKANWASFICRTYLILPPPVTAPTTRYLTV